MAGLKPPFRAEDMEGLYKKVIKGSFNNYQQAYIQDFHLNIHKIYKI